MEETFITGFILDMIKDIKKFFGCDRDTLNEVVLTTEPYGEYESDSDTDNDFIKAYKDFKTPN